MDVGQFSDEISSTYRYIPLDAFVNNANFKETEDCTMVNLPSWKKVERTFMINVWAPYKLTMTALTRT